MLQLGICDDDKHMLTYLTKLCSGILPEAGIEAFHNGMDLLSSSTEFDIILMDISMGKMNGLETIKQLRSRTPSRTPHRPAVIFITAYDDYVFDALRYGASGYLLKGVSVDGLTNAVREAARGGSIIAPDVASKVLQMFSRMAQGDVQVRVNKKNALELTKMEWQVIREVGCGLSNKEIAGRLYLSEGTVRNYISSILRKLELRDRTQLAIWAVQNQNSQPEADV